MKPHATPHSRKSDPMPASGNAIANASTRLHAAMHRATADLLKLARLPKADDAAPSFTLRDLGGNAVSSADLLAQGPLLLMFYRGIRQAGAYPELQALQAAWPGAGMHGVRLVAVSAQPPGDGREPIDESAFDFSILCDSQNKVADAFGLRVRLPADLASLYQSVFENEIKAADGEPGWTLPMPACFVIAPDGVIVYAEVNPDFNFDADLARLMPVFKRLKAPFGEAWQ